MNKLKSWKIISKEWSTWCFAAIPVIEAAQAWLPSAQGLFDEETWKFLTISVAVMGIILKNIPQQKLQNELKEERKWTSLR